ncbi:MAG: dephospho-CoA kinase [Synergistaceae bacterium]|nr:dephospho-CoA kinase [Synergistaceae bacterium]
MWITAITGDIGAGKSTAARIFEEIGAQRINADEIVKELWQNQDIISKAAERWGNQIIDSSKEGGKVNLKAIANIVFSDFDENRFACELLHPKVMQIIEDKVKTADGWIVIEIPLLFEYGVPAWVNRTIFITAPKEIRENRCRSRGWSESEIKKRESFFLPSEERIKRSDFLIKNDGSLEELKKKLYKLAKMFKERAENTINACLSRKIIDLLHIIGYHAEQMKKRAFLVGGAVRDIFLNRSTSDIDVVIEGNAINLLHRIYKNECRPKDWDMNFYRRYGSGTLINKITGQRIDLISTRSELFTEPGKKAQMKPGNISEDIERRDFTVNSIAMSIIKKDWGNIVDPFNGRADIKARLLRVLHDRSFIDDPTRILRGLRFEQRLGFSFEEHTFELLLQAIEQNVFSTAIPSRMEKEWNLCIMENQVSIKDRLTDLGIDIGLIESICFGGK